MSAENPSSSSISQIPAELGENVQHHLKNEILDEENENENNIHEEFEGHDTNTQQPPPHNRRLDADNPLTLIVDALRPTSTAADGEETIVENETLIPTPPPPADNNTGPQLNHSDSQHQHNNTDENHTDGNHTDGHHALIVPTKNQKFTATDYAFSAFSIVLFLADLGINAAVAQKFQELSESEVGGYAIYFWLTFVFITLSALMTVVFEIIWYADEKKKYGHSLKWDQWVVRLIVIFFGFGPVFRYVELILYAYQNQKKAKDEAEKAQVIQKAMMMKEDADFLYMLEKFTESALHVVLQIYIIKTEIMNDENSVGIPEISKIVIASFIMPYTVTCFLRSERQADVKANNMSKVGTSIQFFSRFFIIAAQALVLALFLTSYPLIFMIITVCSWGLLAIWVFTQNTHFSTRPWLECVYRFLIAFIYLFTYVNVRSDPSYYRALFYYSFMFVERGLMVCFWSQQELYHTWYRWPVMVAFFVCFIGGIIIKVIYYECHHPSRKPTIDLSKSKTITKLVKKKKKPETP
ncbi:hypothetical protein CHUAL_005637 [Chamberlinius hualienensis]